MSSDIPEEYTLALKKIYDLNALNCNTSKDIIYYLEELNDYFKGNKVFQSSNSDINMTNSDAVFDFLKKYSLDGYQSHELFYLAQGLYNFIIKDREENPKIPHFPLSKMSRDESRNKYLIQKWFYNNRTALEPYLKNLKMIEALTTEPVTRRRENSN